MLYQMGPIGTKPPPSEFFEICNTFHRCQDFDPFLRVIILVSSSHICHRSRRLSASEKVGALVGSVGRPLALASRVPIFEVPINLLK